MDAPTQSTRLFDDRLKPGIELDGGRFTLKRELARGGMGIVWLARDHHLCEEVVLKFLPKEVRADPIALERLRVETGRNHKLSHPNIIRVHDFHQAEGEDCFISMEYIEGENFAELKRPTLSWRYLRPFVEQLCSALLYAHHQRIVHRDLKPQNLMLQGQKHCLKLGDFGISVLLSTTLRRVVDQQVAYGGTLQFMSPQQLDGKVPQVADDVYSLGATLYDLLAGSPPFLGTDPVILCDQIRRAEPEPIKDRLGSTELASQIPAHVSETIMACLAKDPAKRPKSALEVSQRLRLTTPGIRKWQLLGLSIILLFVGLFVGRLLPVSANAPRFKISPHWEGKPAAATLRIINEQSPPNTANSASQLEFRLAVMAKKRGQQAFAALKDGDILHSEVDHYAVVVDSISKGYLYLFQVDESGRLDLLFPNAANSNPVGPTNAFRLPSDENRAFYLDRTVGTERLFAVFSPTAWPELEAILITKSTTIDRGVGGTHVVEASLSAEDALRQEAVQRLSSSNAFLTLGRWFKHVNP